MSSRSYDVRTEFGAFEHAVLTIAAVAAAFAVLPALMAGLLLVVSVRRVAAARGRESPVWLLPLLALLGLLVMVLGIQWLGWDVAELWHRYDVQHGRLGAAIVAHVAGRGDEAAWPAAGTYVLGVAPIAAPAALIGAAALDLWLRRRKPTLQVRQPRGVELGRLARRKSELGVEHPRDGWALGHSEGGSVVTLSDWEMRHHTLVCGATGAGKTSVLLLLMEAVADRCPIVVVDFKASQVLRRAVAGVGGIVWTMNGPVRWDALRGDPTCLAGKLLAAEAYGPNAEVFKSSAARYLQWVGKALEWSGEQRDPQRVADLLQPPQLQRTLRSLKASGAAPSDSAERLAHLAGQLGQAEREGVSGFAARFGKVVESVAEDALGAGQSALVLEDAVRDRQVVLFSLDVAGYQDLAPKLGAWVLLDLVRVAGVLQYEGWGADHTRACYVVVDEFGALGAEGRHVVHLLERSREAGMACVLASHGLADLERISAVVVKQIVQNTGTHIVLRQSSAEDADAWARILGREQREELSRWLDDGRDVGSGSARWVRDFRVPPEDLIQLGPGDAIVQVGALGPNKPRLDRLRLAQPKDLGAVVSQRETA